MSKAVDVPVEVVAQMRNAPMWSAFEAVAPTLAYDGTVMGDTMSGNELPLKQWASVTTPTLVMDGGASPASMHHAAQALTDVLPNAQHRTLEDQTHAVADEALAPILVEFFKG